MSIVTVYMNMHGARFLNNLKRDGMIAIIDDVCL